MRVLRGLAAMQRAPARAVVTVGVFDGVHVAHQALIRSTVRIAHRARGTAVVITFDPDPQVVLTPRRAPPALMPLATRLQHLEALGVDDVWIIPFTKRFARMSAEQFVEQMLIRRLRASVLIVGQTFLFGRNRRGDMDVLQTLCPRYGVRVIPVRPIARAGRIVSSSRIRRLIERGALAQAQELLGYPPTLYGAVVRGVGRGERLGFPTANLQLIPQVLPPHGVYVVRARVEGRRRRGVMNLGNRPTFGPGPVVCEVHLLGFSGRLHGTPIALELMTRLRGERRFSSPQALVRQVRRDLSRARQLFARSTR